MSLIANVMVVRALSVTEYAILTCSLSVLGMLEAMADSGLAQAALTVGGMHHESVEEKGQILRWCRHLIIRTGAVASLIVIPVWFYMTQGVGGSMLGLTGTAVVLFGSFFITLGLNIFKSFLLLEGHRVKLQKIDIIKNLARVLLLLAGLWLFPSATYVIACASLMQFVSWWYSRQALAHLMVKQVEPSEAIKGQIAGVFWRIMPAGIYKTISSQLFLLLLVTFGSPGGVAGAGALGRFHQFYMVVGSIYTGIFAPRLARTQGTSARKKKLVHYTTVCWFAAISVCAGAAAFGSPLLQILGPAYSHLVHEMQIFMVVGCMYVMNGVLSGMLNTCGWVMPPALVIGVDFSSTVLAITVCDVSTLWGYIWMNCLVKGACLVTAVSWAIFCFRKNKIKEVRR